MTGNESPYHKRGDPENKLNILCILRSRGGTNDNFQITKPITIRIQTFVADHTDSVSLLIMRTYSHQTTAALKVEECYSLYSQPMSMTQMEKIFSGLVFGETFPNPTLVRLLKVKYRAVTYLSLMEGPEASSLSLYCLPICSARLSSQPIFMPPMRAEPVRSTLPMAYQIQASQ